MQPNSDEPQHAVPLHQIVDAAAEHGLTGAEAATQRQRFGGNNIIEEQGGGWFRILLDASKDPMAWLLVTTALLFAWTGDRFEAMIMVLALLPILAMDAFLHRRTSVSTQALASQLSAHAVVLRDGSHQTIAAVDLVPGDVAILKPGQFFPADGVLTGGADVQIDESSLTGEAMPVRKHPAVIPAMLRTRSVPHDSWISAGTRLLTGEARLLAVYTGAKTVYGEIVRSTQLEKQEATPLQRAVNRLVAILAIAATVMCVLLAATRYSQGYGLVDAFVSAATLAVAALPEEFPVVLTFFLIVGVHRLAERQTLVRRAIAVENIGRITCICSDKTGTITEGRLGIAEVIMGPGRSQHEVLTVAARASRRESGDPMDTALLGTVKSDQKQTVATFPFTEGRRREVLVYRAGKGSYEVFAKGAPETILLMCDLSAQERKETLRKAEELAGKGHKVIACATRMMRAPTSKEPGSGYRFSGLVAFSDPLRSGAKEAITEVQGAGIRVILVTGDHLATATAIAREAGIGGGSPRCIEGNQLAEWLAGGRLKEFDVVARATPLQKMELVRTLKQAGEIVAVTGDGVNDVPALKSADIGIAMGERGTRSAREAATIVLLNDNFRTIARAIGAGRQLFWDLRLSFAYLLIVHVPLIVASAIVPFAGYPLLFLPFHVVWLELIIHPTAILVFQNASSTPQSGLMPASSHGWFFERQEWFLILFVGAVISAAMLFAYGRALGTIADSNHARTAGLAVLILSSAAVTAMMSRLRTKTAMLTVALTVLSVILFVQVQPLAAVLLLSPLQFDDWTLAASSAFAAALLSGFLERRARREISAGQQ